MQDSLGTRGARRCWFQLAEGSGRDTKVPGGSLQFRVSLAKPNTLKRRRPRERNSIWQEIVLGTGLCFLGVRIQELRQTFSVDLKILLYGVFFLLDFLLANVTGYSVWGVELVAFCVPISPRSRTDTLVYGDE